MYSFLLSGTKGMNKAVWKKLGAVNVTLTQNCVKREMGDWEVCAVHLYEPLKTSETRPLEVLKTILGSRVINKYSIQIT